MLWNIEYKNMLIEVKFWDCSWDLKKIGKEFSQLWDRPRHIL